MNELIFFFFLNLKKKKIFFTNTDKNFNICFFTNFTYLKQNAYFYRIHILMIFIPSKYI